MFVLLLGSGVALAVLSLHLTLLGRGFVTSIVTAEVVFLTLFVSLDLDRLQRGLITVPAGPLVDVSETISAP